MNESAVAFGKRGREIDIAHSLVERQTPSGLLRVLLAWRLVGGEYAFNTRHSHSS